MKNNTEGTTMIVLAIISSLAILAAFYGPSAFKLWALVFLVTGASSMIGMRVASGLFQDKLHFSLTPYIIATFLALSLVFFFAPHEYAVVAGIIYVSIMGVIMFYWFVWAFVSSFKDTWLKGKGK